MPNAVNLEIRRKLWDGLLPVKIDLAISDLVKSVGPKSIYVFFSLIKIDNGTEIELLFLLGERGEDVVRLVCSFGQSRLLR